MRHFWYYTLGVAQENTCFSIQCTDIVSPWHVWLGLEIPCVLNVSLLKLNKYAYLFYSFMGIPIQLSFRRGRWGGLLTGI